MDAFELREKLFIGLRNVTLESGDRLEMFHSQVDLQDIANTLVNFIPKGIQYQMNYIRSEILEKIPNGATTKRLHYNELTPVLPSDTVKHMKHKLFMLLYTLFLCGEDLDNTVNEMFSFYRSFTINELDLKEEIVVSGTVSRAIKINDNEYVRTNLNDGVLTPTTKTIKQFNNLL